MHVLCRLWPRSATSVTASLPLVLLSTCSPSRPPRPAALAGAAPPPEAAAVRRPCPSRAAGLAAHARTAARRSATCTRRSCCRGAHACDGGRGPAASCRVVLRYAPRPARYRCACTRASWCAHVRVPCSVIRERLCFSVVTYPCSMIRGSCESEGKQSVSEFVFTHRCLSNGSVSIRLNNGVFRGVST